MSIISRKRIALHGFRSPVFRRIRDAVYDAQSWSRVQKGNTLEYRGSGDFEKGLRTLLDKLCREGIIQRYGLTIEGGNFSPLPVYRLEIRVDYGLRWPRTSNFLFGDLWL